MTTTGAPSTTPAEEPARPVQDESPWHHLQQRGWLLWGSAFLVLLALAASIPLIYWALIQSMQDPSAAQSEAYLAIVGLAGLVLIFCLYTVLKQRELNGMRTALGARGAREGRRAHAPVRAVGAVPGVDHAQPAAPARRDPRDHRAARGVDAAGAAGLDHDLQPRDRACSRRAPPTASSPSSRATHASSWARASPAGWRERQEAVLLNAQNSRRELRPALQGEPQHHLGAVAAAARRRPLRRRAQREPHQPPRAVPGAPPRDAAAVRRARRRGDRSRRD